VARKLGQKIILVGSPQTDSEKVYFDDQVRPMIDERQICYRGAINQQQKQEFMRNASTILFPIQWEEHFGLVMIESMACGTPVVALARGSVPEVIDQGISGYFTDNVDELPELVIKAQQLDREIVRQQAEKRFSLERMTDDYLGLYRKMINQRASVNTL
jgi:glycosyltransferase involved in cell wall biosynthesis